MWWRWHVSTAATPSCLPNRIRRLAVAALQSGKSLKPLTKPPEPAHSQMGGGFRNSHSSINLQCICVNCMPLHELSTHKFIHIEWRTCQWANDELDGTPRFPNKVVVFSCDLFRPWESICNAWDSSWMYSYASTKLFYGRYTYMVLVAKLVEK